MTLKFTLLNDSADMTFRDPHVSMTMDPNHPNRVPTHYTFQLVWQTENFRMQMGDRFIGVCTNEAIPKTESFDLTLVSYELKNDPMYPRAAEVTGYFETDEHLPLDEREAILELVENV